MKITKKLFKGLLLILLVCYCSIIVTNILAHRDIYLWDFKAYYYAAKAFILGQNPYDAKYVSEASGSIIFYGYPYPPLTILFFELFLPLEYNKAFFIFFCLNCAFLVNIFLIWKNKFIEKGSSYLFFIFCLLAFNSTINLGLRAGNFTICEQFLLWSAFALFLENELLLFSLIIVLAASFKIQPVMFLFLLLATDDKRKYSYFIWSFFAFFFVLTLSYAFRPTLFHEFLNYISKIDERGITNPSTLALIQDLLKMCKKNFGLVLPKITGFIIYVVAVTTLVVLSMRSFRLLKFIGTEKKKMLVFLSCLLYALALPRFKDYSFILLIVPTYYIIMKTDRVKSYALFFILTIISAKYITLPGLGIVYNFIWKYYPLLIAYFIFGVYICEISQMYRKEMLGSGKPALQPSKTQV